MQNKSRLLISLMVAALFVLAIPSANAQVKILTVPQESKKQNNWCWAAACKAIIKYKTAYTIEQCEIATLAFLPTNCCIPANAPVYPCNQLNWLYTSGATNCQDVLEAWGVSYVGSSGALSAKKLATQISLLNPVMARFDYLPVGLAGMRIVVLHGYNAGNVSVMDPSYGSYIAQYSWVVTAPGNHTWTRTLAGPTVPWHGVDVVFLVDATGSAASVRSLYKTTINALANVFESNASGSKYALTYFMDFPWSPWGDAGDVAYKVHTNFVATPSALAPFVATIPNGGGDDAKESQYTAIYQAITGAGLDLPPSGSSAGDILPYKLLYTVPKWPYYITPHRAYFMFTTPDGYFHDSDLEEWYPIFHPLWPPISACSKSKALTEMDKLKGNGKLFGFSVIETPKNGSENQKPGDPQDESDSYASMALSADEVTPLQELAEASGGTVFKLDSTMVDSVVWQAFDYFMDSVVVPIQPFEIKIQKTHNTLQGHFADVSITVGNTELEMGGFDFLIAYDASALAFTEAQPGDLLDTCDWEYFTYRFGANGNCGDACPSGLLRLIALAEINNGPSHPSCYGPPDTDPHELATMTFFVSNDRTYSCSYVPVHFFWGDCADNAISSVDGQGLYIDLTIYDFEYSLIWDEEDDDQFPEDARIPFAGAPDYCLNPDPEKPSASRYIYFVNGGVDIVCSDSIDVRGDINVNGLGNEIADAVMFTNYFINGLSSFGDHQEASIAASDANADGIALSVADLVYLVRVITGDAQPYPKLTPNAHEATANLLVNHSAAALAVNSPVDIGAGYFVFEHRGYTTGEPQLINGASGMTLKYSDQDGVLRVLVYSMEKNVKVSAGAQNVFVIPIAGQGTVTLTEIQLSDYYGNLLTTKVADELILPKTFALHQNYPNPFNATTTITYELPAATHVKIEVLNVLGQRVAVIFDANETPGVHIAQWNGADASGTSVASGVYVYRLTAGDFSAEKKMVLLK